MRRRVGQALGWLLGAAAIALVGPGCNKTYETPTEPKPTTCAKVAGRYDATFRTFCAPTSTTVTVTVTQTDCSFGATVPGLGVLSGTLTGDTARVKLALEGSCGEATGDAVVKSGRVSGTYLGPGGSGAACCTTTSGVFTLVPLTS